MPGRPPTGATFTPSIELGLRSDGRDGETGAGIEAGGAPRYASAASGLTIEGRGRTLLGRDGDYEEWGVIGLVRVDPGTSGRGLALVVQPAWGRADSGLQRLWKGGVAAGALPDHRAHLHAEIGYGMLAAHGLGVVTPYAGIGFTGEGERSWHTGARWGLAPAASVSLEATQHDGIYGDGLEHTLMLRGSLRW